MILYRNGVAVDAAVLPTSLATVDDATIEIGSFGGVNTFQGRIDDARVYTRVLSPEQLLAMYNAGAGDPNIVVSEETVVGDEWHAEVTPLSIAEEGTSALTETLTITALPEAPVITTSPDTTATAERRYVYDVDATGSPEPTYSFNTFPTGMAINGTTGLIEWTPTALQVGDHAVEVVATNTAKATDTQSFTVHVVAAPPCPADITHFWNLDETEGSLFWDSYGAADGTCLDCPAPATGFLGGAQTFDGVDDEVEIADNDTYDWGVADDFSIELWMKTADDGTVRTVMVGRDDGVAGGLQWWVGMHETTKQAVFLLTPSSGAGEASVGPAGPALNDDAWHHVVAVREGSADTTRLYVDGQEIDKGWHGYTADFAGDMPMNLGYIDISGHYRFEGDLDEVATYDDALTGAEVLAHYRNGRAGYGVCDDPPPDVPTIVAEPAFTQGLANTISWSDESGSGATAYYLERADDADFTVNVATSGWIAGLTHEFAGLADGQGYYYRVKTRDADLEESWWSFTETSAQDDTDPVTAAGDPGATQTTFTFDVPYTADDATSGVATVELWYQMSGRAYVQYPGAFTESPISFTAASEGTYEFYTVGTDSVGNVEDVPGSADATTVVDLPAPLTPTLSAEPEYTQGLTNTVDWTDESASGATSYYSECAEDSSFTVNVLTSGWVVGLTHEFTGLTDGLIHYYRVKARDDALRAESGWSASETSTQDDSAPVTSAGDPGGTQAAMTFDVPFTADDATSGVDSLHLYYQVDGGGYSRHGTTHPTSPISFTAASEGTYDFYTIGTDLVGNVEIAPGTPDASTVVDTTAPGAPILGAEPQYTQGTANTVSWAMARGGSRALEYLAQSAEDAGFTVNLVETAWITETSHEFTALTDAQAYYYRVKARDEAQNEGDWSNVESSTQDDTAPVTSADDPGASQTVLTFDVPFTAGDATSGVDNVTLHYQVDAGGYAQYGATFTTSPISFTAPSEGAYDFYTTGTDVVGNVEDAPGTPDASTVVDTTAPAVPALAAEPEYTQGAANTVSWSDESASGAAAYYAEAAEDTSFTVNLQGSDWIPGLTHEFAGLTDDQIYHYRVKARDAYLNESDWSALEHSTQDTSAPVTAAVDPGATQTVLTFDVPYTADDATSGVAFVELFYQVDGGGYAQYGSTFTESPISFTASGNGAYDFEHRAGAGDSRRLDGGRHPAPAVPSDDRLGAGHDGRRGTALHLRRRRDRLPRTHVHTQHLPDGDDGQRHDWPHRVDPVTRAGGRELRPSGGDQHVEGDRHTGLHDRSRGDVAVSRRHGALLGAERDRRVTLSGRVRFGRRDLHRVPDAGDRVDRHGSVLRRVDRRGRDARRRQLRLGARGELLDRALDEDRR